MKTADKRVAGVRSDSGFPARRSELPVRPNRLGVNGWLGGGRWGLERYLYTLHRLTGLGILFYFILHIIVTSSRMNGKEAWERAMGQVGGPVFGFGEYLVFAACIIHGLNGIRLIAVELGFAVGKPIEPVYPYKTSVGFQRPLAVGAMVLAAAFLVLGGFSFFKLQ